MEHEKLRYLIKRELERGGHLLERDASSKLKNSGFKTEISTIYLDFESGDDREGDITASRATCINNDWWITFELLIECKRSNIHAVVMPDDTSEIPNIGSSRGFHIEFPYPEYLDLAYSYQIAPYQEIIREKISTLLTKVTSHVLGINIKDGNKIDSGAHYISDDIKKIRKRTYARNLHVLTTNKHLYDQGISYNVHVLLPIFLLEGQLFEANLNGEVIECDYSLLHKWFEHIYKDSNKSLFDRSEELYIWIINYAYFDDFIRKICLLYDDMISELSKLPNPPFNKFTLGQIANDSRT